MEFTGRHFCFGFEQGSSVTEYSVQHVYLTYAVHELMAALSGTPLL